MENTYNAEGKRVAKAVDGGQSVRYFYEYNDVVFEYVNGGAVTVFNVIGTNLISREIGSDKVYYFYNGHGDVTALLDATTKNIRSQYQYDSFGNITLEKYYDSNGVLTTDPDEMIKSQIRYAGYQYDEESDYYNLHARYYDPKTARFLQQDTYTGTIGDALSLNLYTYCLQNPIRYYDPTGYTGEYIQLKYEVGRNKGEIEWDKDNSIATAILNGKTMQYKVDRGQVLEVLEYDAKKKVHRLGQNVGHIKDGRIMVTPEYFSKTFFSRRKDNPEIVVDISHYNYSIDQSKLTVEQAVLFSDVGKAWLSQSEEEDYNSLPVSLQGFASGVRDFLQGVGAGLLEGTSYGISRELEVYYDRENELIYVVGKVAGNTITGAISSNGAVVSGGAAVATSPTGVGALINGSVAIYCGSVAVSSAANAAVNVTYAVSLASSGGSSGGSGQYPKDKSTTNTVDEYITFSSEEEARAIAREKVGRNPVDIGDNKLRSQSGKWQYRAKENDLSGKHSEGKPHIHLEELDPKTGEVLVNWHFFWN